jgi:hypothetical protein
MHTSRFSRGRLSLGWTMLRMVLPAIGPVLWAVEQASGAGPTAPRAELSFQQIVLDDSYIACDDFAKPKFDVAKFDPAYFERLRARVIAAAEMGFYVSIMLFDSWSIVLGREGASFTIDGRKTFLLGVSYYGALGAPDDFIARDLDDLTSQGRLMDQLDAVERQFLTRAASCVQVEPLKVIFDTDMDGDNDDVAAAAILHALADVGKADILATGVVSRCPYSPACLDAVNTYYGRGDIPIGVYKGTALAEIGGSVVP